jgi:phospholipid/cholesterol/gamma-HCH transport system substrate-binding protein
LDPRTPRPADLAADERGSTAARVAALAGVIAAVVLVALILFGGGGAYEVSAYFQNAGQLVKGNQVQVGGHVIGEITKVELTDSSEAKVTMRLDDDELTPLHRGTTATIRATSLSGIANRYVSLQPGPNNAGEIDDGGRIGADDTSAPVDLDQLFDTLDPKTRRALQRIIQGSATYYTGKSRQANESFRYLPATLSTTAQLTGEIALDDKVFERFVVDAASVVNAIAERQTDLAQLVGNANGAARAIGDESAALDRALGLLPSTLRKANTTFVNLRSTLDDLDVLVDASKPATKDLAPFLRRLRPLVADARPTIADLRQAIRAPGPGNDLIDLTSRMPRLAALTSRVFPRAVRTLDRAEPVVEYARFYTPDLVGWFKDYGQSAASYDANGHFAKISPLLGVLHFNGTELVPRAAGTNQLSDVAKGQIRRCPGSAAPRPPDGSAPFPVPDCDPSVVPPGS